MPTQPWYGARLQRQLRHRCKPVRNIRWRWIASLSRIGVGDHQWGDLPLLDWRWQSRPELRRPGLHVLGRRTTPAHTYRSGKIKNILVSRHRQPLDTPRHDRAVGLAAGRSMTCPLVLRLSSVSTEKLKRQIVQSRYGRKSAGLILFLLLGYQPQRTA